MRTPSAFEIDLVEADTASVEQQCRESIVTAKGEQCRPLFCMDSLVELVVQCDREDSSSSRWNAPIAVVEPAHYPGLFWKDGTGSRLRTTTKGPTAQCLGMKTGGATIEPGTWDENCSCGICTCISIDHHRESFVDH